MLTNEMYIKFKVKTNVCTHHPNWSFILYIYKRRLWKQALVFLAQEQVIHCPRTGSDEGGGGGGESPTVDQEAKLRKLCLNRSSRAGRWRTCPGCWWYWIILGLQYWNCVSLSLKTKTTTKLKLRLWLTCRLVTNMSCTPSEWVSNGCARHCARPALCHPRRGSRVVCNIDADSININDSNNNENNHMATTRRNNRNKNTTIGKKPKVNIYVTNSSTCCHIWP